jgi:colanic acid/amylovoran biosynthesis protein
MEAVTCNRKRSALATVQKICANGQSTFLLVGNGSCLNRGCEAILRGTVKILRNAFGDCRFVNANFDVMDPPFIPTEPDSGVVHHPLPPMHRMTAKWVATQAADRLLPPLGRQLRFGRLRRDAPGSKAVLSVGGDNYTLDYGIPWTFVNLDKYVLAGRRPLIIWGASIGPFDRCPGFARAIHDHLRREVTAIFVREERSRTYLGEHGIVENVHVMPDPAFVMDPEPVTDEDIGFEIPDGAIGVNLSPLMAKYVTGGDGVAWESLAVEIVYDLMKAYDRPILLIPHVTSPHSDDHLFLARIKSRLREGIVSILPNTLSAAKTKYVISRLSCLVAARTHATIASFSTCVPTVSLAYSVKAWGINESLFGHTRYVVGPKEMTPGTVVEATGRALAEARVIRECLAGRMRTISAEAMAAGHELKNILACN